MLISNDLANFDEKFVKNNRKKLAKKFGGLKERRTFAPAIERTTMVAKAIFEDIYIIRQVVQESESSISMRVPSMKMTLGYDE